MKKVLEIGQRCQSNVAIDSVLEEKLAVKRQFLESVAEKFWGYLYLTVIFF